MCSALHVCAKVTARPGTSSALQLLLKPILTIQRLHSRKHHQSVPPSFGISTARLREKQEGSTTYLTLTIKRVLSCAAFIQHHTQSPDITFLVVWAVFTELRREIVGRANHGLGKTRVRAHVSCHTKISYLRLKSTSRLENEDVLAAKQEVQLMI